MCKKANIFVYLLAKDKNMIFSNITSKLLLVFYLLVMNTCSAPKHEMLEQDKLAIRFDYFRIVAYEKKNFFAMDISSSLYLNNRYLLVKQGTNGKGDFKYMFSKELDVRGKRAWDGYLYPTELEFVYIEYIEDQTITVFLKKYGYVITYLHVSQKDSFEDLPEDSVWFKKNYSK